MTNWDTFTGEFYDKIHLVTLLQVHQDALTFQQARTVTQQYHDWYSGYKYAQGTVVQFQCTKSNNTNNRAKSVNAILSDTTMITTIN